MSGRAVYGERKRDSWRVSKANHDVSDRTREQLGVEHEKTLKMTTNGL
jgi:hypothetical protein